MTESFEDFAREVFSLVENSDIAWLVCRRVESTNAVARRLAADLPEDSRVAITAWGQSRGRGRRRRPWLSPDGAGIYLSFLTRRPSGSEIAVVPLLASLAVVDAVAPHLDQPVHLKWPNDLLVDGAKLGGVLVESMSRGGETSLILGVGINYRAPAPKVVDRETTSLRALSNHLPSMAQIAADTVQRLQSAMTRPVPVQSVVARAEERAYHANGQQITCRTGSGTIAGAYRGLDSRGFLRLESGGEIIVVSAAEVA